MTLNHILDTILQWTKSPFIPLLAPAFCKNKALISGFIYSYQMFQLPLKKIHVLMLKKCSERLVQRVKPQRWSCVIATK